MSIRVAFFADHLERDYDGAVRTMYHIIDRLPRDSMRFSFFTGSAPQEDIGFPVYTVPSISIPSNRDYRYALPVLAERTLERQLSAIAPDVIHISTPSGLGSWALAYARRHNIPVITIYHTHFISYVSYYLKSVPAFIKPAEQWVIQKMQRFYNYCDKILVPSEAIRTALQEIGILTYPMDIWKRGIDTRLFNPLKKDKQWLQSIIGNTLPNVLFASRLVWEKNLELLINTYKLSQQKKAAFNLVIAGEGVASDHLKKEMPHALFLGYQDQGNLARLYASSDVFFFPSISETYGNVVAEAMASGTPLVIADGGGTRDFIDHGEHGFMVSPSDPASALQHIERLLQDSALADRFRESALARIGNNSWDMLVDRYVDHVRDLSTHRNKASLCA